MIPPQIDSTHVVPRKTSLGDPLPVLRIPRAASVLWEAHEKSRLDEPVKRCPPMLFDEVVEAGARDSVAERA